MRKLLFGIFTIATIAFASCNGGDDPTPSSEYTELSGDITSNTTLTAGKKYLLKGFVYVKNNATLTIEPGTVIMGDKASKGTLIITKTGKINAQGTIDKPIIFTSALPAGARDAGDWGGIILLGKAPINVSGGVSKIEGGLTPTGNGAEEDYTEYGGTESTHSSGTLKYVRIEFAGVAFTPDNEINALTMGGVGSGTTISYVQVYRAGDDAFEWFGGTVNCDHLVATYTTDDDFDTDFGYSGNVQFGVVSRFKSIADISGSNGFESDNDGNGSENEPLTSGIFSNITVVGPYQGTSTSGTSPSYQNGAQIRRHSSLSIHNSIFLGFPVGLYIDNSKGFSTVSNIELDKLQYRNNIIAGCATNLKTNTPWTEADMEVWYNNNNNSTLTSTDDVKLVNPFLFSAGLSGSQAGTPDFRLQASSPAVAGANFTGMSAYFQTVAYKGAFGTSNNWMADWTNFEPENTNY